jgi:hypothetical protein
MTEVRGQVLAYCKHYTEPFARNPMSATLVYALIPAELGAFEGHLRFETITDCGRRGEAVYASKYELLALRQPGVNENVEDPAECQLIQSLRARAQAANYVLPLIVPTKRMPAWSKMPVPREVVQNLRRVGGL